MPINIERRSFLKASTSSLVIAGLGPVVFFGGSRAQAATSDFSAGLFIGQMGEWFHIDTGSWNSVELVDVEVESARYRLHQFTVTFRSSPHLEIDEGTYDMSPPDGSTMQLYLQPAGWDDDGNYFTASFSILKPPPPPACSAA